MTRHFSTLISAMLDAVPPRDAAEAAQRRREKPRGDSTAAAASTGGGNLSVLQRRSWPPTAEPRAALLMLDESSAGAEVGVVWDATRARSEQCNTCFEKIDTFPVHLGRGGAVCFPCDTRVQLYSRTVH